MAFTLQVADFLTLVAGTLCAAAALAWLVRGRRWRLPPAPATPQESAGLVALAVILAYFAAPLTFAGLLTRGLPAEAIKQAGSDAWHLAQLGGGVAKIGLGALMLILLADRRFRDAARPPPHAAAAAGLGLLAALVIIPIITGLLDYSLRLWAWMQPAACPPEHPILLALEHSAWGDWGLVQLLAGTVLLTPLTEELLFRGLLLGALRGAYRSNWIAIVASGVVFGVVHGAQPQAVLPLAAMGLILGYLRVRSGSLAACIVAHMLFNARTIAMRMLPDVVAP